VNAEPSPLIFSAPSAFSAFRPPVPFSPGMSLSNPRPSTSPRTSTPLTRLPAETAKFPAKFARRSRCSTSSFLKTMQNSRPFPKVIKMILTFFRAARICSCRDSPPLEARRFTTLCRCKYRRRSTKLGRRTELHFLSVLCGLCGSSIWRTTESTKNTKNSTDDGACTVAVTTNDSHKKHKKARKLMGKTAALKAFPILLFVSLRVFLWPFFLVLIPRPFDEGVVAPART